MKKIWLVCLSLCLLVLPMGCVAQPQIVVLAAASLTDGLNEIIKNYKVIAPNVTVTAVYDSSGKLLTQIQQGAPADVFISAAQKQMDTLEEEGLVLQGTRINLLQNKVVLIVKMGKTEPDSFQNITQAPVIAMGDPEFVPAGYYAKAVFENLGIWEALSGQTGKLALAANVREVLTFVATGNVDAGIVYATDAMIEPGVTVVDQAPQGSCEKIIYPAYLVKDSAQPKEAQAFLDYVASEEGMAVFMKYGFESVVAEQTEQPNNP